MKRNIYANALILDGYQASFCQAVRTALLYRPCGRWPRWSLPGKNNAISECIKRENSARMSKRFNLKGYYILDSMREYGKMCKAEYSSILPYFCYYEMIAAHEMLAMERYQTRICKSDKTYIYQRCSGVRLIKIVEGICGKLKHF